MKDKPNNPRSLDRLPSSNKNKNFRKEITGLITADQLTSTARQNTNQNTDRPMVSAKHR